MNYNFNKNDEGCATILLTVIIAIAVAFGLSCLYAWAGMLLWNWVLVRELGIFTIEMTFWPMWGLVELCSILFKTHNYNNNNK